MINRLILKDHHMFSGAQEIIFSKKITEIQGRTGTGKTTLFNELLYRLCVHVDSSLIDHVDFIDEMILPLMFIPKEKLLDPKVSLEYHSLVESFCVQQRYLEKWGQMVERTKVSSHKEPLKSRDDSAWFGSKMYTDPFDNSALVTMSTGELALWNLLHIISFHQVACDYLPLILDSPFAFVSSRLHRSIRHVLSSCKGQIIVFTHPVSSPAEHIGNRIYELVYDPVKGTVHINKVPFVILTDTSCEVPFRVYCYEMC